MNFRWIGNVDTESGEVYNQVTTGTETNEQSADDGAAAATNNTDAIESENEDHIPDTDSYEVGLYYLR